MLTRGEAESKNSQIRQTTPIAGHDNQKSTVTLTKKNEDISIEHGCDVYWLKKQSKKNFKLNHHDHRLRHKMVQSGWMVEPLTTKKKVKQIQQRHQRDVRSFQYC